LLAVLHFMLDAFLTARLANVGAERAYVGCMHAVAGHGCRRKGAGLGAIDVQRNAVHHHFHVVFLQAGGGAVVAFCGAVVAGLQAIGKLFLHVKSFGQERAVDEKLRQKRALINNDGSLIFQEKTGLCVSGFRLAASVMLGNPLLHAMKPPKTGCRRALRKPRRNKSPQGWFGSGCWPLKWQGLSGTGSARKQAHACRQHRAAWQAHLDSACMQLFFWTMTNRKAKFGYLELNNKNYIPN